MECFSSNPRVSLLLSNLTVVIRVKPDSSKIGLDGDRLVEHENGLFTAYHRYSNGDNRGRTAAKIKDNMEELYGYAVLYLDSVTLQRVFVQDKLTADQDIRFENLHAHATDVVEKMVGVVQSLEEINTKTYSGRMPELDTLSNGYHRRLESMRQQLRQFRTQKDSISVQLPLARECGVTPAHPPATKGKAGGMAVRSGATPTTTSSAVPSPSSAPVPLPAQLVGEDSGATTKSSSAGPPPGKRPPVPASPWKTVSSQSSVHSSGTGGATSTAASATATAASTAAGLPSASAIAPAKTS